MTQKAKSILLGVLGFTALLATIGGSFALAKAANKRDQSVDSKTTSSLIGSDSHSSGASSSHPAETPDSSVPISSNDELRDGPYITVDKSAMSLSVQYSDTELPYGYFTPTIHNPDPEDGANAASYLAICCPSDGSFLDWLDFWVTDENNNDTYAVSHTSGTGVIVRSGKRVKVKMRQKPPIAGGYQIRLRVYSPYYDSSVVRSFVDIDLRTMR